MDKYEKSALITAVIKKDPYQHTALLAHRGQCTRDTIFRRRMQLAESGEIPCDLEHLEKTRRVRPPREGRKTLVQEVAYLRSKLASAIEIIKDTSDYLSDDFFPHKSRNGVDRGKIRSAIKAFQEAEK